MYNIKNKVYVQHLRKFAPHEGVFIMLDNGKYKNVHFSPENGLIFRYDNFSQMINEKFEGKIDGFWEFLNIHKKLRIYTELEIDYIQIFTYSLMELLSEFKSKSKQKISKILELYEVSEYLQENRDINYVGEFKKLSTIYKPIGNLYNSNQIDEIPLEFVIILYNLGKIDTDQANVKLITLVRSMLEEYISSMVQLVKNLVIRDPKVLQIYLNDKNIKTISDIKRVIANNEFLTKILANVKINIDTDLAEIKLLYEAAFSCEKYKNDDDHTIEFNNFINLYKNPDMDYFLKCLPDMLGLNFFRTRYLKFNDLVLDSKI